MRTIAALLMILAFAGCKQSDPSEVLMREGDVVTFAGRKWDIKSSNTQVGPGPNLFSKRYNDVRVDENGYLRLSIINRDGLWYSTEVISQDTMGYGKYAWTLQMDPMEFASNVVLGLFTWDNNTFFSDGNSEVDIEFSKWGNEESVLPLTYSVQPVQFGPFNDERSEYMNIDPELLHGVTTHVFEWTDTLITWYSYKGEYNSGNPRIASWSFDLSNPARIKYEGPNQSQPIIIPAPGNTTNARMNFWTLPHVAIGPANGQRHEITIRDFRYEPF
jgi:hypothetical protein